MRSVGLLLLFSCGVLCLVYSSPGGSLSPHNSDDKLWCHIRNSNTKKVKKVDVITNFPHTAQLLYECWSWFLQRCEFSGTCNYTTVNCGFFMTETNLNHWSAWMISRMGCSLKSNVTMTDIIGDNGETSYFAPTLSMRYFDKIEYAEALRHKIFSSQLQVKDHEGFLAIGLINRGRTRKILNAVEIQEALSAAFPTAHITMVYMEKLSIEQQVHFWRRQDIVIAVHGAALANVVFMKTNSYLIEIFPPYYQPDMYEILSRKSGVQYIAYNCSEAEVNDARFYRFVKLGKTPQHRAKLRGVNLKPKLQDISNLVEKASEHFKLL